MVRLTGSFSKLSPQRILVIGDIILDRYTEGKVRRISPEAPVPVLSVLRQKNSAGGAGNVALNLVALGAEVIAVGRIGYDTAGECLKVALQNEGVDVSGLFVQQGFPTPLKERIIADAQQIVRVDYEQVLPSSPELEYELIQAIPRLLEGVKICAISDYGKGFLTPKILQELIQACKQRGIPVIVDPKGSDFTRYNGATIVKPNLSETYAASGLPFDSDIAVAAAKILEQLSIDTLMITRSESGISLFHADGSRQDFSVAIREVRDVTGAGDTVLAVMTVALASKLPIDLATRLSNIAAGIAVERFGCARVSLSDLARRLLEEDASEKVFDHEHLFALREALKTRPFVILSCSVCEGWNPSLFAAIRKVSDRSKHDLLLYIHDGLLHEEMIPLLASLREVDFILLGEENLHVLCRDLEPAFSVSIG